MTKLWPVRSAKPKQRLFSIECRLLFSMWDPTINKTSQWFSCYKQQIHSEIWMLHIQFLSVEASSHSRSVSPCTVLTSGGFLPLVFSKYISSVLSFKLLPVPPFSLWSCSHSLSLLCPPWAFFWQLNYLGSTSSTESPVLTQPLSKEQTNGHVCVQTLHTFIHLILILLLN